MFGKGGDAEGWLRAGQAQYPYDFWIKFELGNALSKAKPAAAEGFYRAALVARKPPSATVYNNLGLVLKVNGDLDGAIAAYQKAIEIDPKYALTYSNLGIALKLKGDVGRAIAAYQKAIA